MILATDLDRTLLPNGHDAYDGSLPLFFDLVRSHKLTLVYVSGRSRELLSRAVEEYGIELPDYFIGDVGTMIYEQKGGDLVKSNTWLTFTRERNPSWDGEQIVRAVGEVPGLRLQEEEKQNEFKISYYADNVFEREDLLTRITESLSSLDITPQVIWSVDPLMNVGLIDILPESATKIAALEFVREETGHGTKDVIYCGDSGNDLLPLTFGYRSVVVRNAEDEIKEEIRDKNGNGYIAEGKYGLNGNYASGILEGLVHFGVVKESELRSV